jgi:hypothetical protein
MQLFLCFLGYVLFKKGLRHFCEPQFVSIHASSLSHVSRR